MNFIHWTAYIIGHPVIANEYPMVSNEHPIIIFEMFLLMSVKIYVFKDDVNVP